MNVTAIPERLALLPFVELKTGNHASPDQVCLLELAAYLAGERHTDRPECVSQILGSFGRSLNDSLPDEPRQKLVPLAPRLLGTARDGKDQARGLMAADWLIRVYTPTWLRLAGLDDAAATLEELPRQASWDDVEAAVPVVRAAREKADAAWAAARAAAAAARDAVWDTAAGAAAWAAARDALAPTVAQLQESGIELLDRMISPEEER